MGLKARLAMRWPIGELTGWAGPSGFGSRSTAAEVLHGVSLRGRMFIVTGASAGLGLATARALACAGATVVLACRSAERGATAAADITAEAARCAADAGGEARAMLCDLASYASVRAFAEEFLATGLPLHGLVCNAGVLPAPFSRTVDGHETLWQVNYLSHALLCDLLLPALERSATAPGEARIVWVSSLVHHFGYAGGIRWDDVASEAGYVPWKAYSQSKLAGVLHARALDVTLAARGSPVVAHSVHPGAVPTRGAQEAEAHTGAAGCCLSALGGRFHRTVQQGAASIVFAAAAPQLASTRGAFVCNANAADGHASKLARDQLTAFRLLDFGREQLAAAAPKQVATAPEDGAMLTVPLD